MAREPQIGIHPHAYGRRDSVLPNDFNSLWTMLRKPRMESGEGALPEVCAEGLTPSPPPDPTHYFRKTCNRTRIKRLPTELSNDITQEASVSREVVE